MNVWPRDILFFNFDGCFINFYVLPSVVCPISLSSIFCLQFCGPASQNLYHTAGFLSRAFPETRLFFILALGSDLENFEN